MASHLGEGGHVDHRRAELGQLSFRQFREAPEREVGHDQAEHGVAEELQPFVRYGSAVLEGERSMGQCRLQEGPVAEGDAERLLQGRRFLGHRTTGQPYSTSIAWRPA